MKVYIIWKVLKWERPDLVSIHETKESADAEKIRLEIAVAAINPDWELAKELADNPCRNLYQIEEYKVKQ